MTQPKACAAQMRLIKVWRWSERADIATQIWCGERVLPLFEAERPDDARVRNCLAAKRAFLADPSEENRERMTVARVAAWEAAWVAAREAARAVAWEAAREAAGESARAVARAAAGESARAAAGESARAVAGDAAWAAFYHDLGVWIEAELWPQMAVIGSAEGAR